MQKIISFTLALVVIISTTSLFAKTKSSSSDEKIYNMIQTAYVKESDIYYKFRYVLTKINTEANLLSVISRHKKNLALLDKIIDEYNVDIPKVSKTPYIEIVNIGQVCQEGLLLERELSTFYNDSIRTLSTMPKNETIGVLTETFETLRDNAFTENSLIFRRCAY